MKGFELSTDYKKLYELIFDGYRIPAWILYSDEYKDPIYDIVEVKTMNKEYSISVRGHWYETFDMDLKSFKMNCEHLKLKYIMPKIKNDGK